MRALLATCCVALLGLRLFELAPSQAVVGTTMFALALALAAVHWKQPWFGVWAIVVLVIGYGSALVIGGEPLDPLAPIVALVAAGLLETTDVARVRPVTEAAVRTGMTLFAGAVAALSVVVGGLVLVVASSARLSGAVAFGAAVTVALGALYGLVELAARPQDGN